MNHRGRWRIRAVASAIALLGSVASLQAHALALGRITVQSALGEPLRGEIDITNISAEESSSLKIGIASPEKFKAAGLEYPSTATGLVIRLLQRADGKSYLRLSSNRAITEPFVDLIVEANWASGRLTRDYTMLFDPPSLRASNTNPVAPTAPILSRATLPATPPSAREIAGNPSFPPPAKAATPPAKLAERAPDRSKRVIVKAGDTASKIAAQNKPTDVSLDQMLVALLRSNPEAFIGGNINVIKAGAVLDIPKAEAAVSSISPSEATRTVVAQSKDFNAFRRKLAESLSTTEVASADRQLGGKLQTQVEDHAPINAQPDKLTLSKGSVQGKPALIPEDKIAKDKEAKDASSRMAELSKNISDLNKLGAAPATAPVSQPAAMPGIIVPTPALPVASAATAAEAAPAASSATSPQALPAASATSAAVAPKPIAVKKPLITAPPPPEPSLVDQLLENPVLLLLGAGSILALLGGLGFLRYRQQKNKKGHVDSSFLESRLQPDSFFGASGGHRVDTSESNVTGSSMAYTPSQLDASGDVDPVAEADVYLAYGRDEQAEDILKEALRTTPERVAIYAKLLEIYAKRRDSKAFENLAQEAYKLTQGEGPEWTYIAELGATLSPENTLYQSGGKPAGHSLESSASSFFPASAVAPLGSPSTLPPSAPGVDLDLDFSLDEAPNSVPPSVSAPLAYTTPQAPSPTASSLMDLDLDLGLDFDTPPAPAPAPAPAPVAVSLAKAPTPEIDFLAEGLDFTPEPFVPAKPATPPSVLPADKDGMLEFNLDSLSFDLGPITDSPSLSLPEAEVEEDPLEIKFLLAEEFRALGDADGARSLADEVLAKAKGPLKVKVQSFLNALS